MFQNKIPFLYDAADQSGEQSEKIKGAIDLLMTHCKGQRITLIDGEYKVTIEISSWETP